MNKEEILLLIHQQGLLPLFYHDDIEVCINVVNLLYNAGIRTIEFTNRGDKALENFRQLASLTKQRWQGLQLGIGTILNAASAQQFINAGAAFVVCPGVIPSVAETVHAASLLWVPGCMTATEVIIAKENKAKLIKIFPGSLVGPSYITALKEIFSDLLFMPTGGVEVNEENISAWFKAGVCAVGLGSKVISRQALENKDYNSVDALIKEAMQIVKSIKEK